MRWGLGLVLLTTGCGVTSGFLRNTTDDQQHRYEMQVGQLRYVKTVAGSYSVGSIVCLISTDVEGMYMHAMEELNKQAQLQPNQVLRYMREDTSFNCYLFYGSRTLTISADVYELYPPGVSIPQKTEPKPTPRPEPKPDPKPEPKPEATNDEPPPAITSSTCELAFQQLFQTLQMLKKIYPNISAASGASRTTFLPACATQPKEVQWCIRAAYLKDNLDTCRVVFNDMAPAQRRRLFSTFSEGVE